MKKKSAGEESDGKLGAASPFAALAGLRDALPPGPPVAGEPAVPAEPARATRGPARAVVRLERKGRGGKETTRVEKLGLSADELAGWCGALKKALGCGGTVEDDVIVLQGDLRKRIEPVLVARGVRKVTVS